MKKCIVIIVTAMTMTAMAHGADIAFDDAANLVYDAGWTDGLNGGSGFGLWQLSAGDANGHFTGSSGSNAGGSSGDIDTSGRSWGLWSTNGVTEAIRAFTGGDLTTNQLFTISLDNGYLTSTRSVGIGLRNSSGENLWEFYFSGGDVYYTINDAFGANPSTIPYTGDGLEIEFTLTGPTSWLARVTSGSASRNLSGHLISQTDMGIEQVRAWNYEAGVGSDFDFFINSMAVADGTINQPTHDFTYPIIDTGQGLCYDANNSISSPISGYAFAGQDAQYGGFSPDYILGNGGKVVHDTVSGLTWQQSPDTDDDGDIDAADKLTWAGLQAYPAALNAGNFGGYNDWRLPSIKELYSLILFTGQDPSGYEGTTDGLVPYIDTNYFAFAYGDTNAGERIIDAQFGSTNLYVADTNTLFGVNFADGRIKGYGLNLMGGDKTFFVLCVRGAADYGVNNLIDNGNGTISDLATGLMWQQSDSGVTQLWETALSYAEGLSLGGYQDWRLPSAKELQSILDYSRSPDTSSSAAIDPLFSCTSFTSEIGLTDYGFYWSGTTHVNWTGGGQNAAYVAFGRGLGYDTIQSRWHDVHGAGCQRSDPKTGNPSDYPTGHGPQGDAIRIYNYVRCVRSVNVSEPSQDSDADGLTDWYEYNYTTNIVAMMADGDIDGDGSSNLSESGAGTSPIDSASCLDIEKVFFGNSSNSVITWQSVLGKEYRIERSTNLMNDAFTPMGDSSFSATPPLNTYTDTLVSANSVFYRIAVE